MSKFYTYASHRGNDILFRYVENGERFTRKVRYSPSLYVPESPGVIPSYKGIRGEPLRKREFTTIKEAKDFIAEYQNISGMNIHGHNNWANQFVNEMFEEDIQYDASLVRGHILDIEVDTGEVGGFPHANKADFPITAIATVDTFTKTLYVFGYHESQRFTFDKNDPDIGHLNVKYCHCNSEYELITKYLAFYNHQSPDFLSGWNIEGFDIPYMINRFTKIVGEKEAYRLSPFGVITDREIRDDYGNSATIYDIKGVSCLDYLSLYKKHTYITRESYKLDEIAFVELEQRKLSYEEEGSLQNLYANNFQKYITYNIVDSDIVRRLDDKLRLFDVTFALAYFTGVNYQETLGPVKTWDCLIYRTLINKNIVPPLKGSGKKDSQFEGAYVKEPIIGKHRWVISFDLNSLYPHLIQQYNLGPETIVDSSEYTNAMRELASKINTDALVGKKIDTSKIPKEYAMSANGNFFRKDKMSILSEIMRLLYTGRKSDKKMMLQFEQELENAKNNGADKATITKLENEVVKWDNLQMAKKILLNSGYGAIGNTSFKYFDLKVAESITLGGQLSIRWIERKVNEYMNKIVGTVGEDYVIAIDTDSVYVCFDKLVTKITQGKELDENAIVDLLDKIGNEKFVPKMSEWYEELAAYMNAYENRMFMAREVISPTAIWTAKKRYVMDVRDSEGVRFEKVKMKVMGLDAIRSSIPAHCRAALKESYAIALRKDNKDLIEYVEQFRKKFYSMSVEEIAFPRGVNGVNKYYHPVTKFVKGTPKHVKAAITHNEMIKQKGLGNRYPLIVDGDKIKFVELKSPNPTGNETVGFMGYLPKEFDIAGYIDYEEMFYKSYLKPLDNILESIQWVSEELGSLEDFF